MSYVINSQTYVLIANKTGTKIIEANKIIYSRTPLNTIINDNCFIHGSSFEGRQKGSSYLIGTNYKPPIILNENSQLILVPTHSIRNKNCTWFVLNNILNYYPKSKNQIIVEFKNNTKIVLNVSYPVFDKQVLKGTRLESIIRGRNNQKYL